MTRIELAQQLIRDWGERVADANVVTQVSEWIMDAYREICAECDWGFLGTTESISTVASTATYAVAVAAAEVTSGRIPSTEADIDYMSREMMVARHLDLELTGAYPKVFYNAGYDEDTGQNLVGLWPIPTGVLTVEFTENKRAIDLSDSSTIPLPPEFITLIKYFVRAEQARDDKDQDEFKSEMRRFEQGLEKKKFRFRTGSKTAGQMRLQPSDVPRKNSKLVGFDPQHFQNN